MVDDDSANPHLGLWRRKAHRRTNETTQEEGDENETRLLSAEEIEQLFSSGAECKVRDEFFKTKADHFQVGTTKGLHALSHLL